MSKRDGIPEVRQHESLQPSRWRTVRHVLGVLVASAIGLIGGSLTGASYGGNHAPDFCFLGSPGYEGSALMGGLITAAMVLVVGALLAGLKRRASVVALSIIGVLLGMVLGTPVLFPSIAPSTALFALSYVGCGLVGALIGLIIGILLSRPSRTEGST